MRLQVHLHYWNADQLLRLHFAQFYHCNFVQNEEQVELSFKRPWDSSLKDEHSPLYIDKRFIMLSGSSGFYTYAIYEHRADMPPFSLNEARLLFMLKIEKDNFYL